MSSVQQDESFAMTPAHPGGAAAVQFGQNGIQLQNLDDLLRFAKKLVDDGAAPSGWKVGAVAIAIQAGLERGLGILGGMQHGCVINGKFSWMGTAAIALIQNSPLCKHGTFKVWVEGEGDGKKGVCVAQRVGYQEPFRYEFSVKDAKIAGYIATGDRGQGKPGPWKEHTETQLMWRAVGRMGKFGFPDVVGGFPLADELRDHPEMTARVVSTSNEARALPPPPMDDPLNELIRGGKRPAPEAIIEAEVRTNPTSREVEKIQGPPDDGLEYDPPFESHLEADLELAKEEAKQAGLFDAKQDPRLR